MVLFILSFLHTRTYYHSHPVPRFHKQATGTAEWSKNLPSEEQASWLGVFWIRIHIINKSSMPVNFSQGHGKEEIWQQAATDWNFFNLFSSQIFLIQNPGLHLQRDAFLMPSDFSTSEPWSKLPRPMESLSSFYYLHLPITTLNTYTQAHSVLFLLHLTTELHT